MQLSVIICAHNPREDYIYRMLDALKAQTLQKGQWEMLLIDNASNKRLADIWDLAWHPHARHIREDELGLTPARLRGIKESNGEILVFVDDDNVLDNSYFQKALAIHSQFRQLGAYGAGQIKGEFESPPRTEIMPFLGMLALRDDKKPLWSNQQNWNSSIPFGAGLCVLRTVALEYAQVLVKDHTRRSLGRSGKGLLSCDDVDLALFACKLGFGTGVFPELSLIHLIPSRRLERQYFIALAEGNAVSFLILARLWDYSAAWKENLVVAWFRHIKRLFGLKGIAREIYQAEWRGKKKAHRWLA